MLDLTEILFSSVMMLIVIVRALLSWTAWSHDFRRVLPTRANGRAWRRRH
jgi:hypothetical protein